MRQLALTITLTFIVTLSVTFLFIVLYQIYTPQTFIPVSFQYDNDKVIYIQAEIALIQAQQLRGLMFRESLPASQGMLFIFDSEQQRAMWMKNMNFPIDIIFLNSKKQIINILENVPICKTDPCPTYRSEFPAKYSLELPAGFVKKYNINKNTIINF